MTNIIKLKFIRNGQAVGREYTYYTPELVEVGDTVDIMTDRGISTGRVTCTDVPESEIAPFKDRAKTIIGKTQKKCRACGCTWNNACDGGCYWAEEDLCSKCVENTKEGQA